MNPIFFNQEGDYFSWIDADRGCTIYETENMKHGIFCEIQKQREWRDLLVCQMLHKTNLLAIVGKTRHAEYPNNQVVIYDDKTKKVAERLQFAQPVRAVRLRRDTIAVALTRSIFMYNIKTLELLARYDTFVEDNNMYAILEMSWKMDSPMVAVFPFVDEQKTLQKGHVTILRHSNLSPSVLDRVQDQTKSLKVIKACDHAVGCMKLNPDGSRLATTSDIGTLIRVFCTKQCTQLFEFRRGLEPVTVTSLAFSPFFNLLAVGSRKGTVHLFSMDQVDEKTNVSEPIAFDGLELSSPSISDSTITENPEVFESRETCSPLPFVPSVSSRRESMESNHSEKSVKSAKSAKSTKSISSAKSISSTSRSNSSGSPSSSSGQKFDSIFSGVGQVKKPQIAVSNQKSSFSFFGNLLGKATSTTVQNKTGFFSGVSKLSSLVPNYFSSEWSFAKFYTNSPSDEDLYIAFSTVESNVLFLLSVKDDQDSLFPSKKTFESFLTKKVTGCKIRFDPSRGGECMIDEKKTL